KKVGKISGNASSEFNEDEKALLNKISVFGEVVEKAAEDLRPHQIADYSLELATLFSRFYTKNPVLNAEGKGEKEKRILLVSATANVLKNALALLGIECPEEM
ncbi:arginine--tRNA ligase, partial [Candidatus Micrarchaeota archaeon]|nr:arginine--tRNA ligase [Candidatus Micrarchaeota archaeon]